MIVAAVQVPAATLRLVSVVAAAVQVSQDVLVALPTAAEARTLPVAASRHARPQLAQLRHALQTTIALWIALAALR